MGAGASSTSDMETLVACTFLLGQLGEAVSRIFPDIYNLEDFAYRGHIRGAHNALRDSDDDLYAARQLFAEHFFRSNALHCTATARILIPAECSAVS